MDKINNDKSFLPVLAGIVFFILNLVFVPQIFAQQNSGERPNIIFIMTDDHAFQAISAYEDDLIQTPQIDRIAQEGALMEQAFVTNSICGPSRAVIITGKYSHKNGFKRNLDNFNGNQQTLPKILGANGYQTALIGKWHLKSVPQGFDYWTILPGQGNYYNPKFLEKDKDTVYKGYATNITTDLALDWMEGETKKNQPFFLMLQHKAPHRNQMPPLENLDLFNDREFSLPSNFFDDYENQPALQRQKISMINDLMIDLDNKVPCDNCKNKWGKFHPKAYEREISRLDKEQRKAWDAAYQEEYEEFDRIDTEEELVKWQFQRYMEDYLRTIKSVDDNIGRVLDYLEKSGLANNTIVVYTSDQGAFLGEHGLYDKRFMYEEAFRTPMMIKYPKEIEPGKKINEFVLNLDIAQTFLDFAGITPPEDMQGASMKNLLKHGDVNWRDEVYYHYYQDSFGVTPHFGIRTERYKLIRFYGAIDSWELYDLQKDPDEANNVYGDPAYSGLRDSLKEELNKLQVQYEDPIRENH